MATTRDPNSSALSGDASTSAGRFACPGAVPQQSMTTAGSATDLSDGETTAAMSADRDASHADAGVSRAALDTNQVASQTTAPPCPFTSACAARSRRRLLWAAAVLAGAAVALLVVGRGSGLKTRLVRLLNPQYNVER